MGSKRSDRKKISKIKESRIWARMRYSGRSGSRFQYTLREGKGGGGNHVRIGFPRGESFAG